MNKPRVIPISPPPEDATTGEDEDALFSRGATGPFGKLDHEVKTKIDEYTFNLFLTDCRMRGTLPAEMVRDCIYAMVHKKTFDEVRREKAAMDEKHIQTVLSVLGPFQAPK